ncbi:MAG TPA: porin [Polyangiaceae bacterium]|nr:porin [Polyangiaceae bacterium]
MKLSLFSAAPVLLLASSAAFAQAPGAAAPTPPAPAAPAPAPAVAPAPAAAAEAPAPAAAPPAIDVTTPAPAPVVAPAELPPAAVPAETPLAAKLGISKDGFWQPAATLQFWAFGANQGGDTTTTLRIRRAELRVKGEIIPKFFSYNVMIDPARALDNSTSKLTTSDGATVSVNNQGTITILQDYMLTFMSDYADVTVGQFKIPVSYEGYGSASKLLFPERAVVSRRFGDQRDLGIKIDKKLGKHFYYQAAVFNGEGQNKLDSNAQKDLALRLELYPIDGVMIGGVGYTGFTNRDSSPTKDRLEADFKLELANVLLQAEYIHGWDGPTSAARSESAGFYAVVGYTIADKIQPLFRIGRFDSDVRQDLKGTSSARQGGTTPIAAPFTDEMMSYELGLNYYLKGNDAKLQASWSKYTFANQLNRGEVIIAAQAAF